MNRSLLKLLLHLLPGRAGLRVLYGLGFMPAAGGDGEEGGEGGEAGSEGSGGSGSGEGEEVAEDPSEVRLAKSDHDNIQRRIREAEAKSGRLEREARERQTKDQQDQGQYQDLWKTEKERADGLEQTLETERQQRRGMTAASSLNFRDPQDAIRLLSADDLSDDAKADAALKKLARDKPYLIADSETRPSRDLGNGDRDPAGGSEAKVFGPSRMERAYATTGS